MQLALPHHTVKTGMESTRLRHRQKAQGQRNAVAGRHDINRRIQEGPFMTGVVADVVALLHQDHHGLGVRLEYGCTGPHAMR